MESVRLRAFAKVNYALEVRGLRDDGYHEISTVMQSVSLADEVEIERIGRGFELSVEPEGANVGPPNSNTVRRAWEQLCEALGRELPVRVTLRKEIPSGAGLGGASADAAAVLVGMGELFALGLGVEKLREIGGRVGADVPFCIGGGTALGEGVGEILSALPRPPEHRLLLVKPEHGADTGEIYRRHDTQAGENLPCAEPVIRALKSGDLRALGGSVGNVLAPVTEELVPEVRVLREELLESGALGAAMSGTGTTVYGIFATESETRSAAEKIPASFSAVCGPVGLGVEVLGGAIEA